jgi:hypothetical protein
MLALNPADKSAKLYHERCHYLTANPPGGDWYGVWMMEGKWASRRRGRACT